MSLYQNLFVWQVFNRKKFIGIDNKRLIVLDMFFGKGKI